MYASLYPGHQSPQLRTSVLSQKQIHVTPCLLLLYEPGFPQFRQSLLTTCQILSWSNLVQTLSCPKSLQKWWLWPSNKGSSKRSRSSLPAKDHPASVPHQIRTRLNSTCQVPTSARKSWGSWHCCEWRLHPLQRGKIRRGKSEVLWCNERNWLWLLTCIQHFLVPLQNETACPFPQIYCLNHWKGSQGTSRTWGWLLCPRYRSKKCWKFPNFKRNCFNRSIQLESCNIIHHKEFHSSSWSSPWHAS